MSISADELAAIRASFQRLLAERGTEADVRRAIASPEGYDAALWRGIGDLGLAGLIAPVADGGAGGGAVELELLMEDAGAALLCAPFLSSVVIAGGLVAGGDDAEDRARLLPRLISGAAVGAVALTGEAGLWTPQDITVRAAEGRLTGVASYVLFGAQADVLLAAAWDAEGPAVYEVAAGATGLTITPLKTFDLTQPMAKIAFEGVEARRIAGPEALARTLDLGRIALAGEQAGAARRIFEITLDYLRTRVQFGRPIGGFQAMKHMAADLLIEVENATSAARHAASAVAQGAPNAQVMVNLAAFACADAFSQTAATAVQMHGGIAFTWDHPAHLYLRRARADARLFGASDLYRDRYLAALEAVDA